jgi:protein-disulfide isomerase
MKMRLADLATGALVICAVTVTGMAIMREHTSHRQNRTEAPKIRPVASLTSSGHLIGSAGAVIKIVEFADYQCPFCARAAEQLDSIVARSHGRVAVVFHHYPIQTLHAHAFAAAIAAECAGEQNAFAPYHRALFAHPEEIGTKPWLSYVVAPSEVDSARFRQCQDADGPRSRVSADMRLAEEIGVRATPAFVVDNRLYHGLLPSSLVESLSGTEVGMAK